VQEHPRPKPNLFCNQSNIQSRKNSFNSPEKHPGLVFIVLASPLFNNILAIFCTFLGILRYHNA